MLKVTLKNNNKNWIILLFILNVLDNDSLEHYERVGIVLLIIHLYHSMDR